MLTSGKKTYKPNLIDLINDLLPEHHKIVDLNFENADHPGPNSRSRKAVYDEIFKQAFLLLEQAYPGQANLGKYESRLRELRDLKGMVETAFDEGKRKGKIQSDLEIAKQAKSMGLSVADISKLTGLSEKQINNL